MNTFDTARWIWYTAEARPNSYGEFCDRFTYTGGAVTCYLSADGDYTLYVNGRYAASNQYADFEHYKVYDSVDITPYLTAGENTLTVLAWHVGIPTFWYKPAAAGVLYAVECNGMTLCASGERTLSREEPHYVSGYEKTITMQLGPSFRYDATRPDDTPFFRSVTVEKNCTKMYPRPIEKSVVHPRAEVTVLKDEGTHFLVDLGAETVGLLSLQFISPAAQTLTVAWGEHIEDGGVRRRIGERDFSVEYVAREGENDFANYMLRMGGRYVEVFCEVPIDAKYIGVFPQTYPVVRKTYQTADPADQPLYDCCVTTLERCMLEHYVDTPWREQGLYVYDSRNQMLCGYRAFQNGNRDYARANLLLIAQDKRADDFLSITYPCGSTQVIPSFSLYYFQAVREYMEHTGDLSLGEAVYEKLLAILAAFKPQLREGLMHSVEGADYWNFYDWSEGMATPAGNTADAMVNVLCVLALQNMKRMAEMLRKPFGEDAWLDSLRPAVKAAFYNPENGLFAFTEKGDLYHALPNALAVLAGLTTPAETAHIAAALQAGRLSPCSLSMKGFVYDAILAADAENIAWVREDIRRTYCPMLDAGATTVWEVAEGAAAFDDAGSLCHGWSALPILYL
ncbi:MAG: hypothetical protein E7549_06540 [Ruminococcaceae bacterium]|nr:hypothetical protein [Oscillospiraceae bacterium]